LLVVGPLLRQFGELKVSQRVKLLVVSVHKRPAVRCPGYRPG
jgi:hypothetical protein